MDAVLNIDVPDVRAAVDFYERGIGLQPDYPDVFVGGIILTDARVAAFAVHQTGRL